MGSFAGVSGQSAKQVHPLVPFRSVTSSSPFFAGQPRMVAFLAIAAGPALSAFAMSAAWLAAAVLVVCALLLPTRHVRTATNATFRNLFGLPLLFGRALAIGALAFSLPAKTKSMLSSKSVIIKPLSAS